MKWYALSFDPTNPIRMRLKEVCKGKTNHNRKCLFRHFLKCRFGKFSFPFGTRYETYGLDDVNIVDALLDFLRLDRCRQQNVYHLDVWFHNLDEVVAFTNLIFSKDPSFVTGPSSPIRLNISLPTPQADDCTTLASLTKILTSNLIIENLTISAIPLYNSSSSKLFAETIYNYDRIFLSSLTVNQKFCPDDYSGHDELIMLFKAARKHLSYKLELVYIKPFVVNLVVDTILDPKFIADSENMNTSNIEILSLTAFDFDKQQATRFFKVLCDNKTIKQLNFVLPTHFHPL